MTGSGSSDGNVVPLGTARAGGTSSGGSGGGEFEALRVRVEHIEKRLDGLDIKFDGFDARLRSVEQTLARIETDIGTLKNSIVGKIPTWWQPPAQFALMIAIVGLFTAIGGAVIKLARWMGWL